LLIVPCGHGSAVGTSHQGDLIYPPNAAIDETDFLPLAVFWYDYWLKGDSIGRDLGDKVIYYLTGDCDTGDSTLWNRWEISDTWPPAGMSYQQFYLHQDGVLSQFEPVGTICDSLIYDPSNPTPTIGGREYIGMDAVGYGPKNQNPIESRNDVLVYTTPVLTGPLKVAGKLKCVLFASSNRLDTDFAVRVTDVYPDGRSILMTDGILMARHRHGLDTEDMLIPGEPDTFEIDCWSIGHVFNEGHSIRIIVSSANYPRFERNPNTGAPFHRNDPTRLIATNKLYISPDMPSRLLLPVVPTLPLSIAENKKPVMGLRCYPNPFNSACKIIVPENSRIEIFDLKGNKLDASISENNDGSYIWKPDKSTPNGVYLVRATSPQNTITRKIIYLK
jgi:hypothetical protein